MKSLEWLTDKIRPVVEGLGCRLWGIQCQAQGHRTLLCVFVDNLDGGATIEDCQRISRQLSAGFEVDPPSVMPYTLEVSTPGMDRLLFTPEQYLAYIGQKVQVKLRMAMAGVRQYKGQLAAVDLVTGQISVMLPAEGGLEAPTVVQVSLGDIKQTRIVPEWH
jgi:ribosome maturation factor RimP